MLPRWRQTSTAGCRAGGAQRSSPRGTRGRRDAVGGGARGAPGRLAACSAVSCARAWASATRTRPSRSSFAARRSPCSSAGRSRPLSGLCGAIWSVRGESPRRRTPTPSLGGASRAPARALRRIGCRRTARRLRVPARCASTPFDRARCAPAVGARAVHRHLPGTHRARVAHGRRCGAPKAPNPVGQPVRPHASPHHDARTEAHPATVGASMPASRTCRHALERMADIEVGDAPGEERPTSNHSREISRFRPPAGRPPCRRATARATARARAHRTPATRSAAGGTTRASSHSVAARVLDVAQQVGERQVVRTRRGERQPLGLA